MKTCISFANNILSLLNPNQNEKQYLNSFLAVLLIDVNESLINKQIDKAK